MPTASELVQAGYYGYQGWDDASANADFNATHGAGKGNPNGGAGGSGGYSPIQAPDLANLQQQVYNVVNPYYQELAKQAKGDFNTAIDMMKADYTQGTRQAKENLAYATKYGLGELSNTLGTLGVNFNQQNEQMMDTLNKRGAAVYQNNPDGSPNVVQPASFNPSYDANAYTVNPGVSGPNPNMPNLGRGGYEADQLRQTQSLQAQAQMRAAMKPLEQAGLSYKQYTNPNAGFDPSNPGRSTQGADLSQLGTAELGQLKGYNTQTQNYRDKAQGLANQQTQAVTSLANQYGGLGVKSIDSNLQNQLQKQYSTNFVQGGQV